jgi:transposase
MKQMHKKRKHNPIVLPSSTTSAYAAYIGIDWADCKHDICLYDSETQTIEHCVIGSQPEAIQAWVEGLRQRFGGNPIAVALEQKRGPLIYALCQHEFLVLFPVNPQTFCDYRRAFAPSRAKSDPTDAFLLMELPLKHPEKLQAWQPGSPQLRMLQQLVENRRMLVGERVRLTNRITDALKHYFPQVLDWFEDKGTHVFCAFLECYPSLAAAQTASQDELERFFRLHHVVQAKTISRRLEQIHRSKLPMHDIGIVEPLQLLVKVLSQQLNVLLTSIAEFDAKIEAVFASMPDASFFAALPAAGPQLAPRLLVAFGEDRSRYPSAQDLLRYGGISPVTESSGQQSWTHWRWACPRFLRQTFVEWANQTWQYSFWADAFYKLQRAKGKTHQMAIRSR